MYDLEIMKERFTQRRKGNTRKGRKENLSD
jgi:hypothetical protein